jgi:DNA-binding CsgD family transcriptional regulator
VLIASAADGRGATVVLEGPAGIGKTSLIEAAARLAAEAGFEVLAARGGELERDFAYGVVRQLFEPRLVRAASAERRSMLAGAAALAAPVVGLHVPAARAGYAGVPGDDPTAAALHGLYWLTANLAAERTVLLAIDDLHWVDAASLRFLAYVARRVGELPVLLIAASRPPMESHAADLLEALAADAGVQRVEPAALSLGGVAELVRRRLGEQTTDDLASACHAATAGNPFLVHALVDGLAEHGDATVFRADRLPEVGARAVSRSVARRLSRLGAHAEALARAVAVLGTDVEPRHAYRIAELGDAQGAAAEKALMTAGLLSRRRPLEFVHPIVRAAVAEQLSPPERARRHLASARILDADGSDAERIAPHLLAADALGDPWVVELLRRAAARSVARGAPEAAVRYLRRALREPAPEGSRPGLLAELGKAEVRAAMPDDAVEHLRAALATTQSPRERARMIQDLAIGLIAPGRYVEAVAMLQEAVESARESDPELRVRLEAELLCAARLDPRTLPIARTVYDRLPREIPADTPGGRMLVATVAHERLIRGGTAAEVRELAARAIDGGLIAEQSGDSGLVMDAGFALVLAGDFERAERGWSEALADVRRRGSVIGFARTSTMRSILRLNQGRLKDAESDARNAIEAAWEPGYRVARMAHGPLVEALVDAGELDAADRALAAAGFQGDIADTFMHNFVLFARGRLRLAQNRPAEAVADLEELGRRERKWRGANPGVFPYRSLIATTAGFPRERSLALAREELELARAWGAAGPLGRALRALARVEGGERGVERLDESLAVLDGSGWQLEHARTLVDLGAARRRAGHRRDAREPLQRGMELAHACGARPLVAYAREELVAAGARPRRVMTTGVDALTASERRVARMAAEGMTNRDIAQALFVTVRTVEVHLTHAYQKLDIAARDELPAALASA